MNLKDVWFKLQFTFLLLVGKSVKRAFIAALFVLGYRQSKTLLLFSLAVVDQLFYWICKLYSVSEIILTNAIKARDIEGARGPLRFSDW